MKVLRQIKSVAVYDESDCENNNSEPTLQEFDKEPGFYFNVIRPMLSPGHEGELFCWLKGVGVLVESQRCKNELCNVPMVWTPARVVDKYQWRCPSCSQRRPITDSSIFNDIRCNFKNIIRTLLGWCKSNNELTVASILGVRKQIVKDVYSIAAKIAEKYIHKNLSKFVLGGANVVVVVDVFPDGFSLKGGLNDNVHSVRPILCIAEIKHVPTRFWLQALDSVHRNEENLPELQTKALEIVRQLVLPGSIVIASLSSAICSYYSLQQLNVFYPTIISTEGLTRHDNLIHSVANNLNTIWEPILPVCEEAQHYGQDSIHAYLFNFLWNQAFGKESFEMLISQMTCF